MQVCREQARHAVTTVAGEINIATMPGLRQQLTALAYDADWKAAAEAAIAVAS